MGNQPGRGQGEMDVNSMRSSPLLFHDVHSENIELSSDRTTSRRVRSFCKGICFSYRPIAINERVYLKLAETDTSWSGVVRFGYTSVDPNTINAADLPRYACPDLTNKPGFWAKALSARFAEKGTLLMFYVTRNGDVMFGINGEEKGVFFSGVLTDNTLWSLVDIYGNSTAMEFMDGAQLNNYRSNTLPAVRGPQPVAPVGSMTSLSVTPTSSPVSPKPPAVMATPPVQGPHTPQSVVLPQPPTGPWIHRSDTSQIRHHVAELFSPVFFHRVTGKNITLMGDRTIAVRREEEYCNAYVFMHRPISTGEKVVVQINAVDPAYTGGLAFGMTVCDPSKLKPIELPDDSDLLIDRPEYWVVFKNVCTNPEIGDELSFHLAETGEVKYAKNRQEVRTLMHVDKTMLMWPFLDLYGNTQTIKILGVVMPRVHPPGSQLQHTPSWSAGHGRHTPPSTLTPPHTSIETTPNMASSTASSTTPPPRPPPPRNSPSGQSVHTSPPPPTLPPKQHRPLPQPPGEASPEMPPSLPPPLIPTPAGHLVAGSGYQAAMKSTATQPSPRVPAIPPRHGHLATPPTKEFASSSNVSIVDEDEAEDNASNECSVCLEKDVDCVLYSCGHMCMCYECAMDVKSSQALCPICRQQIKDVIKIYRS